MDELIKSDLFRYMGNTDLKSFINCLKREPGFRYTFFLRKCSVHKLYSLRGIIYRIFYHRYSYKYGYQIPKQTKIGRGLMIKHFGFLVVNSSAVIGDNCYLSHGVTIGQTNRGNLKGAPVVGNKVWLGPGSVLVGNIRIGDNVLVAPNAYINFDVPSNSIVIGNPAKIYFNEHATDGYIVNTV